MKSLRDKLLAACEERDWDFVRADDAELIKALIDVVCLQSEALEKYNGVVAREALSAMKEKLKPWSGE